MTAPAPLIVTRQQAMIGVHDGRTNMNEANCLNCKYFKGTYDDGKTICGNREVWNTWIRPEHGCERWEEAHNDN